MTEFSDDEWNGYITELRRYSHTVAGFRVLSWNPQNATPRPEQQRRMSTVEGGTTHRVAVVAGEQLSGFATSVLAFVNPNIGTFSEHRWADAWAHLGIAPVEQLHVERALQHLRASVELEQ